MYLTLPDLNGLFTEMDALLGDWGNRPASAVSVNLWANDDDVLVTSEIPGLDLTSLNVSVEGETLNIAGKTAEVAIGEGAQLRRRERSALEFRRSIQLPYRVDADKAEARYADGVLSIALRRSEAQKPKKIAVKAL